MYKNVPNIYFACSGKSSGETELTSFDGALLDAGVGNTNLLRMSSIVPPACEEVEPFLIPQGALLPIAYVLLTSDKIGEVISSAVAMAIPDDKTLAGVIMENSDKMTFEENELKVRNMVKEAMEMRGIDKYTVKSSGVEAKVEKPFTTTFAGVVLWWK